MRLSLLGVSAALAVGVALSACNSSTPGSSAGSLAAMPSAGGGVTVMHDGHKFLIRPAAGVKMLTSPTCGSQWSFCFYVYKGNSGPYVSTSDGTAPLYNVASIVKVKNDKVDKKFKTYFYPDPGDPTSQYITYKGKVKSLGTVKYTDVYCIGFTPSDCANGSGSILYLGIALAPKT
jgi:hypothetical protein